MKSSELSKSELSKKVWRNPIYLIAFGFGSGLLPKAPGTWGTLAAVPLYYALSGAPAPVYLFCVGVAFAIGVWVSARVSRELGVHDHAGIVWDEVVGYLLTLFLVPFHWVWVVLAFILFRLFDIWKPWPIRYFDTRVQGGLGIMLDDVLAAVPAWAMIQLLIWLQWPV